MQHNLTLHKQTQEVIIEQNFLKMFVLYHELSHEMHKQMNKTLRKSNYGRSHMQMGQEHQDFL